MPRVLTGPQRGARPAHRPPAARPLPPAALGAPGAHCAWWEQCRWQCDCERALSELACLPCCVFVECAPQGVSPARLLRLINPAQADQPSAHRKAPAEHAADTQTTNGNHSAVSGSRHRFQGPSRRAGTRGCPAMTLGGSAGKGMAPASPAAAGGAAAGAAAGEHPLATLLAARPWCCKRAQPGRAARAWHAAHAGCASSLRPQAQGSRAGGAA